MFKLSVCEAEINIQSSINSLDLKKYNERKKNYGISFYYQSSNSLNKSDNEWIFVLIASLIVFGWIEPSELRMLLI